MSKIKIAVDNQVSFRTIDELNVDFDVVFNATDEPDDQWIEQALDLGAQVFVSPDLDIPNYLADNGYDWVSWIDLPQNLNGVQGRKHQLKHIVAELTKIRGKYGPA